MTWRPIFMPRDEFDAALQENFVVDTATLGNAEVLVDRIPGLTFLDALEILMRIGVLLSEENIPDSREA